VIDPDGQLEDWFQNEITGDVYYNPVMKKGDESQLGENWAHMGENGMFGSNDQLIVKSNSDIAQVGSIEVSVSDPNSGNEIGKVPMHTALFKGDNAKSFMSEQGYKRVPNKVLVKRHTKETSFKTGRNYVTITEGEKVTIGLTGQYVRKNYVQTRTTNTEPIHLDIGYNPITDQRRESESYKENLIYGPKTFRYRLGKILKFGKAIHGKLDYVNERSYNLFD
jgi:hypothetical protein